MTSAQQVLEQLWAGIGGQREALYQVELSGSEPALPSSFFVGVMAQASIAAVALAAAKIWEQRSGRAQSVSVAMRRAALEFISERLFTLDGAGQKGFRDPLAGIYQCKDGGWVRPHITFPQHRAGFMRLLGLPEETTDKETFAKAYRAWNAQDLESAAAEAGLPASALRSFAQWDAHPQSAVTAAQPLIRLEKIGEAPPIPLPKDGTRPLQGIRALDLTRIIAGPVCGRVLAAHGADVLAVSAAHLPFVRQLVIDTNRGKRACNLDLRTEQARFAELLRDADMLVQGYRPGALQSLGFGPQEAADLKPGIIYASLSAYGPEGPWAGRRGFDSLVQTATGFNLAEAEAAGETTPKELPSQALDHASGYLLALGMLTALQRRATEGGSWHVYVSLARTGHWLRSLGRQENGFAPGPANSEMPCDLLEISHSGFGLMNAVRHAAIMSLTPPRWDLPVMPLGSHPAVWPE